METNEEIKVRRNHLFTLDVKLLSMILEQQRMPLYTLSHCHVRYLYDLMNANPNNQEMREQHILRVICVMKKTVKTFGAPQDVIDRSLLSTYRVFAYENGEIIAATLLPKRRYKMNRSYKHYQHAGDFLRELTESNVRILDHPHLADLASTIDYENWILDKYINKTQS